MTKHEQKQAKSPGTDTATVSPRLLTYETIAAIASHAVELAKALRVLRTVTAPDEQHVPGYPLNSLWCRVLEHATNLELAFNPTGLAFDSKARLRHCLPPGANEGGFTWLMNAYHMLIEAMQWKLCYPKMATGGTTVRIELPRGQHVLKLASEIDEVTIDTLENAGVGLGNAMQNILKMQGRKNRADLTDVQLDELRAAIRSLGKSAQAKGIQQRVEMQRAAAPRRTCR